MNFSMVGSMRIGKDTDTKKAYSEKTHYDNRGAVKGYSRKLNLIMKCGKDTFFPSVGGYMGNIVYSLSTENKSITFPADKRNDYLDKVANFKKFSFVDGDTRFDFTTEYDLALCVYNMLQEEKYKEAKFRVSGEVEYSNYTTPTGEEKLYKNYKITKVYVSNKVDAVESATITTDFYVDENSIDESKVDEGILTVTGYVPVYDSNKKKLNGKDGTRGYFEKCEFLLSPESDKKERQIQAIKTKLAPNESNGEGYLSKTGIHVRMLNRTEGIEFTEEMLTDDERFDIEMGLTTFDEIKAYRNGGKGSSYITKEILTGFKPKFLNGTEASFYTIAELVSDGSKKEELVVDFGANPFDSGMDDLFGDVDIPF